MQIIYRGFLLILLLHRIKGSDDVTEQENISFSELEDNFNNTADTTITSKTKNNETRDEVGNTPEQKPADVKSDETKMPHPRLSRLAQGKNVLNIECLSCTGSGDKVSDDNCYKGDVSQRLKCANGEACYTELHHRYIKRGCMLPSSLNRTFVCKCSLCNDKPADDVTYFEYKSIRDWHFDNLRLEEPEMGLELLCKDCETTGINRSADKICTNGSKANFLLCGHNQICYTNINRELDYVARGCVNRPAFNSMYFFCNNSSCNIEPFENPAWVKRRTSPYEMSLWETDGAHSNISKITKKLILLILTVFVMILVHN